MLDSLRIESKLSAKVYDYVFIDNYIVNIHILTILLKIEFQTHWITASSLFYH